MYKFILNHKSIICSLVLLLGFNFFGSVLISIPSSITKIMILLCSFWGYIKVSRTTLLSKPMKLMFFFLLVSCFSSLLLRNQNFIRTFIASNISYTLFLYFFFSAIKLNNRQCSRIILCLSILYCLGYLMQLAVLPHQLFKLDETMLEGETTRLRLTGSALATLGYFFFLNEYVYKRKNIYVLLTIIALFTIFMMGFRTILAALIIGSFFYLAVLNKINLRIFFSIFIVFLIGYYLLNNTQWGINVLNGMIERQESETFVNKDYVRWLGFDAYWNHYLSPIEKIFGIGSAYENSPNEKDILLARIGYGAVWVDWGIVGLSFYNGMITCLIQVYCIIKVLLIKIPTEYRFLQIWLLAMLLSSVTSGEYIRLGNTALVAMVFYWIELNKLKICN